VKKQWFNRVQISSLILIALMSLLNPAYARNELTLCSRYHFTQPITPALTAAEKSLICGSAPSPEGALAESKAWAFVPSSQAILSITAFLQSRGYLKPKIQSHGKEFQIDPGPISRVSRIELEGAPAGPDFSDVTQRSGKILTPKLLSELEQSALQQMMSHGYPCPDVHAEANSDNESIVLHIRSGPTRRIGKVTSAQIPGTMDGILSRYYAFKPGDLYDDQLLAISSDRAIFAGVVEDTFFVPKCNDTEEVDLHQQIRPGAPRIFTLGVSVNTEEIGRISLSLRNSRVGSSASDAEIQISASSKIQDLTIFFQNYFLSTPSRQSIRPLARVMHENENPFEIVNEEGEIQYGTSWDAWGMNGQFSVGPQFSQYQTLQGLGPNSTHALFLTTEARLISHVFEFNHNALRGGSQLLARAEVSSSSVGSQFSARRLELTGEKFWRPGSEQKRAPVVFRTRAGWRTTGFSEDSPAALPPNLRYFLGGQENLRGFGRMELPGNSVGGLSAWFGNFEIRPHFWGEHLEPIILVDVGEFGNRSFSIQSPLYWSPGFGISWASPIGTLQSTLAHGFVSGGHPDSLSHWQFYLRLEGYL
jgi:outer membrane translocation and assembly module TamA